MDISPTQALDNARRAAAGSEVVVKDLWTLSLQRIFEFKTGPFFEHSVSEKVVYTASLMPFSAASQLAVDNDAKFQKDPQGIGKDVCRRGVGEACRGAALVLERDNLGT